MFGQRSCAVRSRGTSVFPASVPEPFQSGVTSKCVTVPLQPGETDEKEHERDTA
jgi:hypothetical protein